MPFDAAGEERDRRVRSARRRGAAIISASPDSDCPHVLSERLTITADSPERASRSGSTCSVIISCISYGTPGHRVDDLAVDLGPDARRGADRVRDRVGADRARRPGAGCSAACRGRGSRTAARCASTSSSRRSSSTPITAAMASRVTSSWVGPSPPHTTTASAFSSISRERRDHPRQVVADLAVLHRVDADRRRAARRSSDELVSTIWPSSSSVPIARTSASHSRSDLPPSRGRDDVDARDDRERDRDPERRELEPLEVGCRPAQHVRADREHLEERPSTCRAGRAGSEMPVARRRRRGRSRSQTSRAAMIATGTHQTSPRDTSATKPPRVRTLSASGSRNAPERVVPSRRGEPAVDAVGDAEHEPQRPR